MTESYFKLYHKAHTTLIDVSEQFILAIFKGDVMSSPTQLVKTIIEEHTKLVNEQTVMVGLLYDVVDGRKFDMPQDAQYFIDLINDSLVHNQSLMHEINAKRRETLLEVRGILEQQRDAQIIELSRHPRRRWRFRR